MVNVSGGTLFSKRKRHKLCKGIKLRTMASVSMGIAVLALFRSETIYFHATQRYLEESKKFRPMYSSPTRFGFVPRKLLRTSVLHEMDTLKDEMDALKNKGRDFTRSSSVSYVSYPRVISLDKSIEFSELSPRKTYRQVPPLGQPNEDEESDEPINDFERPFLEQCEPRVDPSFYPTCNGLHEVAMDFDISLLSTKGSWRTVWKVEHHKAAIKILHLTRQFDQQSFEQHRLDATIMEHLTASPHVVDAYGYCGQSVVTEMAPTGGRDYVKQNEIRSQERLKIARDLARGLADIHALQHLPDYNGKHSPVPKFAHNDINIANTVQVDGRIKWNDFNIGVLLRAHTKNSTLACGSPVRFKADLWRSPEEIRNTSYVHLEQSDMFGFGNILYQVMTRHQPWTHKEPGGKLTVQDIAQRKLEGKLPTIPEQYYNTSKPALQTLLFATLSCYHPNPEKRPTSYQLAQALGKVYERLKQKKNMSAATIRDLFVKR